MDIIRKCYERHFARAIIDQFKAKSLNFLNIIVAILIKYLLAFVVFGLLILCIIFRLFQQTLDKRRVRKSGRF